MRREPWKLKDVVMMAILGVLFAVVYMAVFYGGTAISVALTPLGLSAFGFELIYGVWFMAATIGRLHHPQARRGPHHRGTGLRH